MLTLSVLMPVYNGAKYVNDAINSILTQTYNNFELIIIDDGSNDNSLEIIKGYSDNRINVIQNTGNLGIVKSLNKGLDIAKGKYIARMDCDDISLPERFEKQINYLENNFNVGILGCNVAINDKRGRSITNYNRPITYSQIRWALLLDCPIMHPTVMFRKELFDKYGGYSENYKYSEDYEYWSRLSNYTIIEQLPDVLVILRKHDSNIGNVFKDNQLESSLKISMNNITNFIKRSSLEIDVNPLKIFFNTYHRKRIDNNYYNNNFANILLLFQEYYKYYNLSNNDIKWIKNHLSTTIVVVLFKKLLFYQYVLLFKDKRISKVLVLSVIILGIKGIFMNNIKVR